MIEKSSEKKKNNLNFWRI